ncbi:MAG TPA: nucleoside-diphosphate sugar epimerase/dehydratase [Propionicimonas sp.]
MYRRFAEPHLRFGTQFLLDGLAWAIALVGAQFLRFEFDIQRLNGVSTALLVATAVLAHLLVALPLRLYQGRYSYGSFEEVRALALATVGVSMLLVVPVLLIGPAIGIPRSTVLIALPMTLVEMFAIRYVARLVRESQISIENAEPAIVFGAGYLGETLVRRMLTDIRSPYYPVGLLDDDPRKRHARIRNVDVLGSLSDLPEVVERTGAKVLVVAVAAADAHLMTQVAEVADPLGVQVKVLPPFDEVLKGASQVNDLRDLSIEDLLGRRPVDTDVEAIAGYLTGRRVLVTGAGGSIGSELCRQIQRFSPAELVMLDRDETGLQAAELAVYGHGLLDGREVVLADIRDMEALQAVFAERRPEVVFHAAALKHLPMLQQYPEEAWKTNVLGTRNVLRAARSVGVQAFINISTDKAADPVSVLGHSKRLAERLTAQVGKETGLPYLSVRFGNVLGSRGSMLPLFTTMIHNGGPLTVTHPDVTRYFMTIPEACQLVVQAGAIGSAGEVLILDMGEPVRIMDIAERMIEMSGRDIKIVITGLREGEKLNEVLRASGEEALRPKHPKISHAVVPTLNEAQLDWGHWSRMWAPGDLVGNSGDAMRFAPESDR